MSKPRKVLILKHVPNEGAGTIADFLLSKNITFESVNLYEGAPLPASADSARALVIMGGPMNVYEEEAYPFLRNETAFIRDAVQKNVPCLGVCLGSQLIAKALGKKIYKATVKEIGWDDVHLTREAKEDPLFSLMTFPKMRVLQWHEDTFDLPEGAMLLASTSQVPNQAFRYKKNIYGLQFHVEVNRPMLEDWFRDSPDLKNLLDEYDTYRPALDRMTTAMYEKFFQ